MFKRLAGFGIYTRVNRILALWLVIFAATAGPVKAANTQATLLLSAKTAKPGDTITAAVRLEMAPGWHTYWKNGGDSGGPSEIKWNLPAGVKAGEIQWPTPEKFIIEGLTTYVYHGEAVLLVPLKLGNELKPGPVEIKAKVSWLECEKLCVPGSAEVTATLEIGSATEPSANVALIEAARQKLPAPAEFALKASWESAIGTNARKLLLSWPTKPGLVAADFYPYPASDYEVGTATKNLPDETGLKKEVTSFAGTWPTNLQGVLVFKESGAERAVTVDQPIQPAGPISGSEPGKNLRNEPPVAGGSSQSLWLMLLYAFIGGLILNIMPCVLPVIALKILGFVEQAKESPQRVRQLGLAYTIGVLASFLGLAALVLGLKSAGHAAGWGMQFGSPEFTIGFAVLVTLVALNLFGVFEVSLGGGVMSAAGELASRHGLSGAFFNGVLATILATPCTAPFLSLALGFAFSQSATVIVLIFLTVGVGLASPYLLLSWFPGWLKFLPKPGVWMERFKVLMGFPMLATALWLVSLVSDRYGERSWWLGMFLVFVALASWIFGTFIQRGSKRRGLALGFLLAIAALGYFWVLEGQLQWRRPLTVAQLDSGGVKHSPAGYDWQRWSPAAVQQAQAEGRIAVVDFTAKWCITCNSIVKPAFGRESVLEAFRANNVAAFVADYTDYSADITAAMKALNRAAVPLVLVFPPKAGAEPAILPDPNPLLGPGSYAEGIVAAVKEAAR